MRRFSFHELSNADLVIDAIYEGDSSTSSYGGEPLHHLLPGLGTQGGFRKRKGEKSGLVGLVMVSTGNEPDWPDELDPYTGTFIYFGDNRTPGKELHNTKAGGNKSLAEIFALAHGSLEDRIQCPVILIFETTGEGRNMVFRGLAVPGSLNHAPGEDLVAIWRSVEGERFQNYRAVFTVLDSGIISGDWLRSVFSSRQLEIDDPRIPPALLKWMKTGKVTPLLSPGIETRSTSSQLPQTLLEEKIVNAIYERCKDDPFIFEPVAAEIWRMSTALPMSFEMTRRYRDGGRDAVGHLDLGPIGDQIHLTFALEAKLYNPKARLGVRATSRLISRLKHREFGVLVTTAPLDKQAYTELRQDQHPVVVMSGHDIAETLIRQGINSEKACLTWLERLLS